MKNRLDFIIIGAQKSGTTTLFKYLEGHPQIYMPPEKEAPFFSDESRYQKGWDWYLQEFFTEGQPNRLWGKASPQYMAYPCVPERIHEMMPDIKLIAILRDPVERAYSHFKMNLRRGIEKRPFQEAICDQLENIEKLRECSDLSEIDSYILYSEYGRILKNYLKMFNKDQILVLFMEELSLFPVECVSRVYNFLDIENILPNNLGQRYHQGGSKQRWPKIKNIKNYFPVKQLWKCFPQRYRRRFKYWFEQYNVIKEETSEIPLEKKVFQDLVLHFNSDAVFLKENNWNTSNWVNF